MIKSFFNDNLLPIVEKILEEFKKQNKSEFLTSDVIKEQIGRYVNDNCYAYFSFNANYGTFLQEKSKILGIKEKESKVSFKDRNKNRSSCSLWEFVE